MMYPYTVDYWPELYDEDKWVRIEVPAESAADAEERFLGMRIECSYHLVHEPLLED